MESLIGVGFSSYDEKFFNESIMQTLANIHENKDME
jgi:hypothetical protein